MGFSIIPVEDIDIASIDVPAKQPGIEQFSAISFIFLFNSHDPSTTYVLPSQRALLGKDENGNDKNNSGAFS
jgi:hypothetical protein